MSEVTFSFIKPGGRPGQLCFVKMNKLKVVVAAAFSSKDFFFHQKLIFLVALFGLKHTMPRM